VAQTEGQIFSQMISYQYPFLFLHEAKMAGYLKTLSVLFLLSLVCLEAQSASPVRALLEENRLEEAMTICRQMEVLSTTDIDNFLACSWACFRYDKEASAERFMEKIRKAGQVGTEYQVLQAFSLIKKKKYVDANAALEKLYQENRTTSFLLPIQELRAELAELEGKSGVAGFIYKQMSAEGPVRARVQWGLARYYLSQGDLSRARTHLEQTAKLWPTHLASRFNLGILSLQTDNLPEATQRLVECYRLNKADPGVLEQLGILFEKKGKLPEAIRYWQKAASLSKDALISREKLNLHVIQVVDALIESRQYDSALEKIETFYKGENKNPLLLLKRGMVYQRTHKYDKALKDLKAYRVANPSDSTA
jgi:tetratricopeptide (TPR) repeat protein